MKLVPGLRDMGYDFAAAVAELVDDSIEADATLVAIDIESDGDDSWVRIADNSVGMTPPLLGDDLNTTEIGPKNDSALRRNPAPLW